MIDNYVKFSFIFLCFLIALGSYWFCRSKRDWAYLAAAMGFTVVSDFLLLIVGNYPAGVFTFCFVHVMYILRVRGGWGVVRNWVAVPIMAGVLFFLFFLIFLILRRALPILIILGAVYALLFSANLIFHLKYYKRGGPNRRIMLSGLILFVLCDIHVLLFNLHDFIAVPAWVGDWGRMWIWVFYAPSQLLLGVSAVRWKEEDIQ